MSAADIVDDEYNLRHELTINHNGVAFIVLKALY